MSDPTIERRLHIAAPPAVVFQVISDPGHVAQWWPDEARYRAEAGSRGEIVFRSAAGEVTEGFEVVEARPPRLFSFRWTQAPGIRADLHNSFLVVFELTADGDGTLLRMTESGFHDRGWDAAAAEAAYRDHVTGWDLFLPRIAPYVASRSARAR